MIALLEDSRSSSPFLPPPASVKGRDVVLGLRIHGPFHISISELDFVFKTSPLLQLY